MKECKRIECMGSNGCIDKCWKPQRQWVGLTYPDREALRYQFADWNYPASLVNAIEAKLKEKNHGM